MMNGKEIAVKRWIRKVDLFPSWMTVLVVDLASLTGYMVFSLFYFLVHVLLRKSSPELRMHMNNDISYIKKLFSNKNRMILGTVGILPNLVRYAEKEIDND